MALVDLKSDLTWYGKPPEINYISDDLSGAKGFTVDMWKTGQSKKETQFTGVSGNTYTYPSNLVRVFEGLNLQSNSYNTNDTIEFRQPFIVRGMQRSGKSNSGPQRWGNINSDGLIRGGAVTVASRTAADVSRIAKFLGTTRGKLWITKQIGLGLSNPKVETITGSTRVHLGVTSLLSVAGSPLGLHFTAHGVPGLNRIDDYENVQRVKIQNFSPNIVSGISSNRLVSLAGKYRTVNLVTRIGNTRAYGLISNVVSSITGLIPISGIGGPQSVYGIGSTRITRKVDTVTDAVNNARLNGYTPNYTAAYQYASLLHGYNNTSTSAPKFGQAIRNVDDSDLSIKSTFESKIYESPKTISTPTIAGVKGVTGTIPNSSPGNGVQDISTARGVYGDSLNVQPNADIRNYMTIAYGRKKGKPSSDVDYKGDFRNLLGTDKLGFTGKKTNSYYYQKNNLETKYGFGELGKVGADRTDVYSYGMDSQNQPITGQSYDGSRKSRKTLITSLSPFKENFRGDRVNALDVATKEKLPTTEGKNAALNMSDVYEGESDLIKFYFQDGEYGKNVMVFRATIIGLTDSYSPGWEKIDMSGRPDGAFIYTSFERTVSFNFRVAALSRGEMVPIWRKLNYLATYTMPNLKSSNQLSGKVSGPFMRITIGDMFQNTPGFISSLSYTVVDDTSWDIADDSNTNKVAKQLPTVIDVSMTYTVISDYRPQLNGRAYSLSAGGNSSRGSDNWLQDANI